MTTAIFGGGTTNLDALAVAGALTLGSATQAVPSGSAPLFGARAWCIFNGATTGTNAPAAGGNVASITRNSAGNYTVTFATAMPDNNYAPAISSAASQTTISSLSAGSFVLATYNTAGVATDAALVSVSIFR